MTDPTDVAPANTPAYHEDDISQVPAVLLLSSLG